MKRNTRGSSLKAVALDCAALLRLIGEHVQNLTAEAEEGSATYGMVDEAQAMKAALIEIAAVPFYDQNTPEADVKRATMALARLS